MNLRHCISLFFLNLLICLGLTLSPLQAQQNENPTPPSNASPFPTDLFLELGDTISDEWDEAGQKISASIFESLTDRELFKEKIVGDLQVGVRVQRRVFDNQDIIDSWTVVDIMKVPFYLPIPLLSQELSGGTGNFGLQLGLSFGGQAYHIRQVSPQDWKNLRTVDRIERDLQKIEEHSEAITDEKVNKPDLNDSDITVINEDDPADHPLDGLSRFVFWRSQDPKIRARYNKLWNILTHPLKLPLSAKRWDKYPVGDVASFGLEGSVQLGASVGWSDFEVLGLSMTSTRAGLGITTYVKGDFRVSLWKENDRYAQVKLTRESNKGVTYNVGTLSLEQELFEGFVVLDQNLFRIKEQFIPFSLSINRNRAKQFDVGYRYDMTHPQAREAYEHAVLGRFKKSHDLSQQEGSGVVQTYTREQERTSRTENYKMKLSILFEKASANTRSTSRAVITMDGVEHKLYTSETKNYRAYDTLWGRSESKRHSFVTTFNERRFRRDPTEGLGMRIEGRIEDSNTSAEELYRYISEVETAIAKPGLFPKPPFYNPFLDCDEIEVLLERNLEDKTCQQEGDSPRRQARYDKTSFFYQVELSVHHLLKIQNATKDEIWNALEQGFGVKKGLWASGWRRTLNLALNSYASVLNIPLALFDLNLNKGGRLIVAYRFYRGWKDLRSLTNPKEIVEGFGKLYRTIHYSPQLVKATRILAGRKSAKYFLTAKADQVWGQISEGGTTLGDIFPIADEAQRRYGYDRIGPSTNVNPEAMVASLKFDKLDEDTARLTFNLRNKPQFLFFRVDKSPSWGRYQNLVRLIIGNNGEFKKGVNEIIIKRDDRKGYMKKLRNAFFNGSFSTFSMAYSVKEQNFGPVASTRFRLRSDDEREEDLEDEGPSEEEKELQELMD